MIINMIFMMVLIAVIIVLTLVFCGQTIKAKARLQELQEQERIFTHVTAAIEEDLAQLERYKKSLRERIMEWADHLESDQTADVRSYQDMALLDMHDESVERCWENPVMNMTFQQKLSMCRAQGIEVKLEGIPENGISLAGKSMSEMIGLFSNLSDNAMEACCFLPEEKRWIRLSYEEKGGKMRFVLENSYSEAQSQNEKTWKQNKQEHGIGKDIINEIVARNKGWVTFERKAGVYRVEMMLPV